MPQHFQLKPEYAYYCPEGDVSLQQAIDLIAHCIGYCAGQQIRKLLVNAVGLTGFDPPTLADRFFLAIEFSEKSRGLVCAALVVQAELIHPRKFGVTVAHNRGLIADVFTRETEADAWLRTLDLR